MRSWNAGIVEDLTTEKAPGNLPFTADKKGASLGGSVGGSLTHKDGHIWFFKPISEQSAGELLPLLYDLQRESLRNQLDMGMDTPPPIHLHIHSYGGGIFPGFAMADAIMACRVPVYTYVEGAAASAATLLSAAGAKRFIRPNAMILIHQLSTIHWGKYEEFKDEMRNLDAQMDMIWAFYQTRTKMKESQIKEILKRDLWLPANKALKLGLVDKIQ